MEFLQKDDVIEQLSEALYNLQFTESTILPKLEEQLKDKKQEIENIVNAVQKGFTTQTLKSFPTRFISAKTQTQASG